MMHKSKKITLTCWMSMILLLSIFIPIAFVENASAPIGSNELLLKGSQKDGFITVKRSIKLHMLTIPQLPEIKTDSTNNMERNVRSMMLEVFIASWFILLLRRRLLWPIKYTSNYL
ncbi:hypothetical protein [Paenibacillus terrigena]|uniref:hypothetical protein n=1 Tax=Paenibacillus terrigena TaxID=369333 RepID=UPI000366A2E2|nr:hypothetical protein [Paenibacillus terrigena]